MIDTDTRLDHPDADIRLNIVDPLPSGHVRVQFFYKPKCDLPAIKDSVWVDGPVEKVTPKRLLEVIQHKVTERKARDAQEAPRWTLPAHVLPDAPSSTRARPPRAARQPWNGEGGAPHTEVETAPETKGRP